ncbi:MAG: M67 family metallopeptidase [Deltaproteobacteria bacterium]|nr:M67 family metallopeptidase [Deltaproteobacteria bacterium]
MLKIKKTIYDQLLEHASREDPIEACGYLVEKDGEIIKHYEMTNTDQDREHFSMDPKEQFQVVKEVRAAGMKIKAVYHSHPETPARPSEEDIKLAFDPTMSYVIITLLKDSGDRIKSFLIKKGVVENEIIEIIE